MLPFGRIALTLAALVAAAAIGIAVMRNRAETPSASPAATTPVGDVPAMIAQLEARLKQDPKSAQGWQMLGWSYFETGRYADAAKAYARAAALEPANATYWSALGEALVLSGPGGSDRRGRNRRFARRWPPIRRTIARAISLA
jgi:cytochrome c-type biogenesis protein CcmH